MEADVEFEAEDIDDAFDKLAKHFATELASDSDLEHTGEIIVRPIELREG